MTFDETLHALWTVAVQRFPDDHLPVDAILIAGLAVSGSDAASHPQLQRAWWPLAPVISIEHVLNGA